MSATYLRIGEWDQAHPVSRDWACGTVEAGLSVYDLDAQGAPVAPDEGEWADVDLADRLASSEPKLLVTGTLVGQGHDGEPLIADIRIVGEWSPA